jgi:hypothetical protein
MKLGEYLASLKKRVELNDRLFEALALLSEVVPADEMEYVLETTKLTEAYYDYRGEEDYDEDAEELNRICEVKRKGENK